MAERKDSESSENTCVVCFKEVKIFSVGSCNHRYCFICSSRIRCLCSQNECPICRANLPQVIFTKRDINFDILERELRSGLYEKKFRISFETLEIQGDFYKLLEDRCLICDKIFPDFKKLKDHLRKEHEKFYCEICTDALSLFSSERKFYSRSELARHRKTGDVDDKSHKGHPLCNYCELRFLDKDDLWRHLRREHNYCHFCDADGVNLFYGTIQELRNHFKAEHYLCEESDCSEEGMAIAFRTEIDMKAHKASVHSRGLSKLQARQTRTLDIDFSYGNRGRNDEHHRRGDQRRSRDTQREFDEINEREQHQQPVQASSIDTSNRDDFPALSLNNQPVMQLTGAMKNVKVYGTGRLHKNEENFPQLPSSGKSSSNNNNNHTRNNKVPSSSSLFKPSAPTPAQSQPGKSAKKSNNNSNNRPKESPAPFRDDFPALGPASGPQTFTARPTVKAAPKAKPQPSKATGSKDQKQKANKSTNQKKKSLFDDEEDEELGYPALTPVPVGFTVKRSNNIKYDSLIDNYATPLSMSSKIQTISRNDEIAPRDEQKKSAPNLSSADNFPSLNGESSFSSESAKWVIGPNQQQQPARKTEALKPKVKEKIQQNRKSNNKLKVQQFTYTPIANSAARNEALDKTVEKVVNNNEMLQEFKNVSKMFMRGDYFAQSYYETCQHILSERFEDVFPELLVLLPSIEKQQELLTVHREHMQTREKSGAKPKMKTERELVNCDKCKQVVMKIDLFPHVQQHLSSR